MVVIVEDGSINYEEYSLITLSSEYMRIFQITQIFSNLQRMGGK
jgi:hypothetical protein